MPYFYKLEDYYKNPEDFFEKVEFTIGDFTSGCETKGFTGNVYIFLIDDIHKIIKPHPKKLKYEYFTEKEIQPEFIIFKKKKKINIINIDDKGKLLHNQKIELMKWFDKRLKKDNNNSYYIHITCIENLDSIIENGIYAETQINNKNRIGNRLDSSNNLNNSNLSNSNSSISYLNQALIYGKTPNKIKKKSIKKKIKKKLKPKRNISKHKNKTKKKNY